MPFVQPTVAALVRNSCAANTKTPLSEAQNEDITLRVDMRSCIASPPGSGMQAGVGTALVSVLAGVPMAPDQDYDQPITAWQHPTRPALPGAALDEGRPGWGGLGGKSDSQHSDWSLGSSFGRGHFGEVIPLTT